MEHLRLHSPTHRLAPAPSRVNVSTIIEQPFDICFFFYSARVFEHFIRRLARCVAQKHFDQPLGAAKNCQTSKQPIPLLADVLQRMNPQFLDRVSVCAIGTFSLRVSQELKLAPVIQLAHRSQQQALSERMFSFCVPSKRGVCNLVAVQNAPRK